MKKLFLLAALVLVFYGCGSGEEKHETLSSVEIVDEERLKPQPEIGYESFDAFFHAIIFLDGDGLDEEHREGFYFEIPEGDDKTGIVLFEPQKYYKKHKDQGKKLIEVVAMFKRAKLIRGLRPISEEKLPESLKVHNRIISHPLAFAQKKRSLERKINVDARAIRASVTSTDAQSLAYIYDLSGEYDKARALDDMICETYKDRCKPAAKIVVSGKVVDGTGKTIDGAKITVLNYENETYSVDETGDYFFELKGQVPQKIRLRATAEGYADAYKDFYIVTDAPNQTRDRDFTMAKAHGVVGFDISRPRLANRKNRKPSLRASAIDLEIESDFASVRFEAGKFYITTPLTEYELPRDGLIRGVSGEVYEGPVTAYLYEFDKSSDVNDLLRADATDDLSEYFGSMLKTFGMPFIQFYDDAGTELHVDRSNPMKITSQIAEMEALREGSDGIYAPLTEEHMEQLVRDSEILEGAYPITREYLIENQLTMFPQWWILDRLKGKWNAEGVRVLNTGGLVKTIFYSIDRETGFARETRTTDEQLGGQQGNVPGQVEVQANRQGEGDVEEDQEDDNAEVQDPEELTDDELIRQVRNQEYPVWPNQPERMRDWLDCQFNWEMQSRGPTASTFVHFRYCVERVVGCVDPIAYADGKSTRGASHEQALRASGCFDNVRTGF